MELTLKGNFALAQACPKRDLIWSSNLKYLDDAYRKKFPFHI